MDRADRENEVGALGAANVGRGPKPTLPTPELNNPGPKPTWPTPVSFNSGFANTGDGGSNTGIFNSGVGGFNTGFDNSGGTVLPFIGVTGGHNTGSMNSGLFGSNVGIGNSDIQEGFDVGFRNTGWGFNTGMFNAGAPIPGSFPTRKLGLQEHGRLQLWRLQHR